MTLLRLIGVDPFISAHPLIVGCVTFTAPLAYVNRLRMLRYLKVGDISLSSAMSLASGETQIADPRRAGIFAQAFCRVLF